MNPTRLAQINQDNSDKYLAAQRHEDILASTLKTSDTVLSATQSLISYLEGHVTKTEVVNQLEAIATPDVKYVVEALQVLDSTLKARPLTDLSGITELMASLVEEAKAIPKELPQIDIPVPVDNSEDFKTLITLVESLTEAVKAQELVAEAPQVNVDAPVINVDAPDLEPLQKSIKSVVTAVKAITIPEYKTDNKEVEKLLKKSNVLLKELLEKPVGGGGGGSSRVSPYEDANGTPMFVQLQYGGVPTFDIPFATRIETVGVITYIGKAQPGSSTGAAVWSIQKIDESAGTIITWADGNASFDNVWNSRASLAYA